MSAPVYILSLSLFLATILLVFGMRYVSAAVQARAHFLNADTYRRIAETAATAQSDTAASVSSIQATLTDIKSRLAAVEQILKAVE